MSVGDGVKGALLAGIVIWHLCLVLGPFRLAPHERRPDLGARQRILLWVRGWGRRPRQAVTGADWSPRTGHLFLLTLLAVVLPYAGVWVLFGPGQTFRLGGALALAAGIGLDALLIGYFRRPTDTPPAPVGALPSPVGTRFPPAMNGYRADEVDAFFDTIDQRPVGQLQTVTFRRARVGYNVDAVHDALAQATRARHP